MVTDLEEDDEAQEGQKALLLGEAKDEGRLPLVAAACGGLAAGKSAHLMPLTVSRPRPALPGELSNSQGF